MGRGALYTSPRPAGNTTLGRNSEHWNAALSSLLPTPPSFAAWIALAASGLGPSCFLTQISVVSTNPDLLQKSDLPWGHGIPGGWPALL